MAAALDNPVWHALTGPHAHLALGRGKARHYPRDIAPFSAVAEATPSRTPISRPTFRLEPKRAYSVRQTNGRRAAGRR